MCCSKGICAVQRCVSGEANQLRVSRERQAVAWDVELGANCVLQLPDRTLVCNFYTFQAVPASATKPSVPHLPTQRNIRATKRKHYATIADSTDRERSLTIIAAVYRAPRTSHATCSSREISQHRKSCLRTAVNAQYKARAIQYFFDLIAIARVVRTGKPSLVWLLGPRRASRHVRGMGSNYKIRDVS